MILQNLFYRLPFRFDAGALQREIAALPDGYWNRNYRELKGTASVPLIAAEDRSEGCAAPLATTEALEKLPCVAQVLAAFDVPLGRARLVRLETGGGYPPHADTAPYWQNRVQIHVPVQTHPQMHFFCARQPVHMSPGEVWSFNNAQMHRFVNDSAAPCIHLVVDVEAAPDLWRKARPAATPGNDSLVAFRDGELPVLPLESTAPAPAGLPAVPQFERPVFIVAAPRSGSTLLFETLSGAQDFWTLGGEGGAQVETIGALTPQSAGPDSNRLTAADLTAAIAAQLKVHYAADLRDRVGKFWRDGGSGAPQSVRFLEKTPKNALRIPFFKALFPDAKFIFLHREARANVSAIIEAWRSGKFVTYSNLPGWQGLPWSLLLIPGWRGLCNETVGRIAVRQWIETNATILDDLAALPREDWCAVRYEDLLADPAAQTARLCDFAQIECDARLRETVSRPLKLSAYTLTRPDAEKWRQNESVMSPFLAEAQALSDRLGSL